MNILSLLASILVPTAIALWVAIGVVALLIFLKNKLGGHSIKASNSVHKETFVQGCKESVETKEIKKTEETKENTEKSNLCL